MTTAPFGPECPWYDDYTTFGAPNVKWCEQTICAPVNEPANAWSNGGFLIVGAVGAAILWRRRRPVALVALASIVMGLMSFAYHATNNALTQYADFAGMYLYEFGLIALQLSRTGRYAPKKLVIGWGLAVVGITALTPVARQVAFPIQLIVAVGVVAIMVLEIAWRRSAPDRGHAGWFVGTAVSFGAGMTFSALDLTRKLCVPDDHFLQGHALWHVFAACGVACSLVHFAQYAVRQPGAVLRPVDARAPAIAA